MCCNWKVETLFQVRFRHPFTTARHEMLPINYPQINGISLHAISFAEELTVGFSSQSPTVLGTQNQQEPSTSCPLFYCYILSMKKAENRNPSELQHPLKFGTIQFDSDTCMTCSISSSGLTISYLLNLDGNKESTPSTTQVLCIPLEFTRSCPILFPTNMFFLEIRRSPKIQSGYPLVN